MHFRTTLFSYLSAKQCHIGFVVLFASFLCVAGCKKNETDSNPPVISLVSPHEGDQFFFGDAIPIVCSVTDDKQIENIRIQITNASNQVFLQTIAFNESGKSKDIAQVIYNDDLYLESGTYFVRIVASDGVHEVVEFSEIQLYGKAKELQKIVAVFQQDDSNMRIDTLSSGGFQNWENISGDFGAGVLDSRHQVLLLANESSNNIQFFELPYFNPLNALSVVSSNARIFSSSFTDDAAHEFFIGTTDGRVYKTNSNNLVSPAIENVNTDTIQFLEVTENYIYTISQNSSDPQNLNVYHRGSGILYHSASIEYKATGLLKMQDENHILVVGNTTTSVFKMYNNETNAFNTIFNFYDQTTIYGVWPAENGSFYAHHEDGLVRYANGLENFTIGLDLDPHIVRYEELTQRVFVVTNDGLHILSPALDQELDFFPSTDIRDVFFLYNK